MRTVRIILYSINCLVCLSAIVQDKGFLFPYLIFGLSALLIILEFSLDAPISENNKQVVQFYKVKYTRYIYTVETIVSAPDKETALKKFKKEEPLYDSIISIEKVETE